MGRTPMPIVAGILDIISGVLSLLAFLGLLIASITTGWVAVDLAGWIPGMGIAVTVVVVLTVVSFIVGSLALVGGIYALQRKNWGLALTGSVFALVPLFALGLAAIILTAISKNEFE